MVFVNNEKAADIERAGHTSTLWSAGAPARAMSGLQHMDVAVGSKVSHESIALHSRGFLPTQPSGVELRSEDGVQILLGFEETVGRAWSTALRRVGALSLAWQDETFLDVRRHSAEVDEAHIFEAARGNNTTVLPHMEANSSCPTQDVTRTRSTTNYSNDSANKTVHSDGYKAVRTRRLTRQLGSSPGAIPINEGISDHGILSTGRIRSSRRRKKEERRHAQVYDHTATSGGVGTISEILAPTSHQVSESTKRCSSAQREVSGVSIFAQTKPLSTRRVSSDGMEPPCKMHSKRMSRRAVSLPINTTRTTNGGISAWADETGLVSDNKRLYTLEAQVSDMLEELGIHSSSEHKKETYASKGEPYPINGNIHTPSQHKVPVWQCRPEIGTAPLTLRRYTRDIELVDSDSSHTDTTMDMANSDAFTTSGDLSELVHYSWTLNQRGESRTIIGDDLDILKKPRSQLTTIFGRIERTSQYIENIGQQVSAVTNLLINFSAQSLDFERALENSQSRLTMASQNIPSNSVMDACRVPKFAAVQDNKVEAQRKLRSLHKRARALRVCSAQSRLCRGRSMPICKQAKPADLGSVVNTNGDKSIHEYGNILHLETCPSDHALVNDRQIPSLHRRPTRSVQARLSHIDSQWAKLRGSLKEKYTSCPTDTTTDRKPKATYIDEVANCASNSDVVVDGLRVIEHAMRTMLDHLDNTLNQAIS